MAIKLYPDFEHNFRIGDRLIYEYTVQNLNGHAVISATQVIFSPAGSKGGRKLIFVDDGEPEYLEEISNDE